MRATLTLLHPSGVQVAVLVEDLHQVDAVISKLLAQGYRTNTNGEWPKGPDGSPLCMRHGEGMTRREKQGDIWFSHRLVHPVTGEELYCRGVRYGPANKDGFLIDP